MELDYLSIINDLIIRRELSDDFYGIKTFYSNQVFKLKNEILKIIPQNKHYLFKKFIDALSNHIFEIRNQDCSRTFFEGMKFGIGFEKYLNDIYK